MSRKAMRPHLLEFERFDQNDPCSTFGSFHHQILPSPSSTPGADREVKEHFQEQEVLIQRKLTIAQKTAMHGVLRRTLKTT